MSGTTDGVLLVQERRRFYRDCLTVSLPPLLHGAWTVAGVPDADGLIELVRRTSLTDAIVEGDAVPWDVGEIATRLRRARPNIRIIALASSSRVVIEGVTVVPRSVSPEALADLVEPGFQRAAPFVLTATSSGTQPLSTAQLNVLALLSLGMTVPQIASRLELSQRSVTRSKEEIFSKLHVRTQAQAVASALSAGLLGPPARSQSA